MADIKWISVQSAGNPNGSDGVAPITMFNNPQFEVNNDTHGGLGGNDHYFSIVIENNFTVYKMIKNNVRSNQSIRGGYLAIAFSIPRGFELLNSTPYLVLMDLWKTFRDHCMTLKDKVAGIYEYNSTSVDKTVLDEIAKTFLLRSSNRPYRPMNSKGTKALVVVPVDKMEKLLADVHYEEFSNYSEILIAETANPEANFERINNLKIPRPTCYTLWVDSQKRGVYNDVDEIITVQSRANSFFYQNVSKTFSIRELLNGLHDPDISIDESNERIDVFTTKWAEPRKKTVTVHIVPEKLAESFQYNKLLKLDCSFGEINLDRNFSFILVGEQISVFTAKQIEVSIRQNNLFELVDYEIGTDDIQIKIKEKQQQRVSPNIGGMGNYSNAPQRNANSLQPTNVSPVVDVCIYWDNFTNLCEGVNSIKMFLLTPSGNEIKKSCSQIVAFKRFKGNVFEGHFYLPKYFTYSYLQFSNRNYTLKSDLIDVTKDTLTLTNDDFKKVKVKRNKWNKSLISIVACSLISFLLGIIIGMGVHALNSMFSSGKTPKEKVVNADENTEDIDISYNEAIDFLEKVGRRFRSENVNFTEIQEFNDYFKEHSTTLLKYDSDYSKGKVCNQIRDYSEIAQYIQNGNLDLIKEALNRYDNSDFHIFRDHAELVKSIFRNNSTQNHFMNNYSKITGFDNIEEILNSRDDEGMQNPKPQQDIENQGAASNRNSTTAKTTTKTTTEKKFWICVECKNAGKKQSEWRYDNQNDYLTHVSSHNGQRLHQERN